MRFLSSDRPVLVFPDVSTLARAAAEQILSSVEDAVRARGAFRCALAGGKTPRSIHSAVVRAGGLSSTARVAPWDLWFGDERCVPSDDVDSNYRMVSESLLSSLRPVPTVHRVPTELGLPSAVAAAYEAELFRAFALRAGEVPVFDLILLGVGSDGHTASLFPGDPTLEEPIRLVVAVRSPKPPLDRVTLTLPVLCAARVVIIVVSGADKAAALRAVLESGSTLPAARVRPTHGRLFTFADADAASLLPPGLESVAWPP